MFVLAAPFEIAQGRLCVFRFKVQIVQAVQPLRSVQSPTFILPRVRQRTDQPRADAGEERGGGNLATKSARGGFQTRSRNEHIMPKLKVGDHFPTAKLQDIAAVAVEFPAAFAQAPATVTKSSVLQSSKLFASCDEIEDSPRRRGGLRERDFKIKNLCELCVLCGESPFSDSVAAVPRYELGASVVISSSQKIRINHFLNCC